MSQAIPLEKMTVEEKLLAMESLWNDLCRQAGDVPSPAWHGDVLEDRESDIRVGRESFDDWERAKQRIAKETL